MNIRIVIKGMECNRVVYGRTAPGCETLGREDVVKRTIMEPTTHAITLPNHTNVHGASLRSILPRECTLGSGRENTSTGRVTPSLGSKDSVRVLLAGGFVTVGTARAGVVNMSAGGLAISDDESEGGRGETR